MKEKTKIIMLRTNRVDPDPRVEKEVNTLLINELVNIEVLAWDRTENYKYRREKLKLDNGEAIIHRIGIKAGWGVGIKKNTIAFIKYVYKTTTWLIKSHKEYDFIHACDLQTVIPSIIPLILFRKRLVYDIYDYFSDTAHGSQWILNIAKKFETCVINKATATIICSEKRLEQIFPARPQKMCVIHNAPSKKQIDTSEKKICQSKSQNIKIVYVGNLVEDRCIRELIEVAKKNLEFEFHIGGIGALADMVKEAADSNRNIFYYGKMTYADVLILEKECDIMIALYDQSVPNHKYAAPNKFYESLALGKPIIMLHNTGVDDIIDKYIIGETVDQDISSISDGIHRLINNKFRWNEIAIKEKELFEESFCWEIMEDRLNNFYKEII